MPTLLEIMSEIIEDFVRRESQNEGVVGMLVFGSFVRGKVRATSDLDLLVVQEGIKEHSWIRQVERGVLLEVYRWPLNLFAKPFLGEMGDPFSDAFRFDVMRTGRILYDPKRILQRFRIYAQTHKLSASHVKSLTQTAHKSLRLAQNLLEEKELEGAELEIRKASEELVRAILLEADILEINPPKVYLPHLRSEAPDFYSIFREAHNLKKLSKKETEASIRSISEWHEKIVEEIRRMDKEDLLKEGGAIQGAQTELSNAQDCLDKGDIEAAALQARYAAILIMSSILRLMRGTYAKDLGPRYVELIESKHPFGDVLSSVMNFSYGKQRLKEDIDILGEYCEQMDRGGT